MICHVCNQLCAWCWRVGAVGGWAHDHEDRENMTQLLREHAKELEGHILSLNKIDAKWGKREHCPRECVEDIRALRNSARCLSKFCYEVCKPGMDAERARKHAIDGGAKLGYALEAKVWGARGPEDLIIGLLCRL